MGPMGTRRRARRRGRRRGLVVGAAAGAAVVRRGQHQEDAYYTEPEQEQTADPTTELQEWGRLLEQGLITWEEYEAKKRQLLGL